MEKAIRVKAKIQNNVLWHAIYDRCSTLAEFCRNEGLFYHDVCSLLNLSNKPCLANGKYRPLCILLSEILGIEVAELFPAALYGLERTEAVFEFSFAALPSAREIKMLPAASSPEDEFAEAEMLNAVLQALKDLPPRERTIVKERYLDEKTLSEIGAEFNLSRERIRSLSERGLARIRKQLRDR